MNLRLLTAVGLAVVQLTLFVLARRHYGGSERRAWVQPLLVGLFALTTIPILSIGAWEFHLQMLPHWVIYATIYPLYIYHVSSVLLLLGLALLQIVRAPVLITRFMLRKRNLDPPPAAPAPGVPSHDPRRRIFLRQSLAASAGIIFAGSAYATYRCDDYEIDEVSIPVAGLPGAFEGFTIALISDIHSSVFMLKDQMMEYARVVNSFGADLIAVPGDFVNSMLEEVYPFAEAFSSLRAPYGVFGVLGNHDYYTRKVEAVAAEVEQCGIKLLRNTNTIIEKGGQKLALLGIDDSSSFRVSIPAYQRAARGIDEGILKVLLCHRPIFFDKAADRGVELMLAGHTHGGQVVLGRFGDRTISPLGITSKYIAGLYEREQSRLYVSRGVGTVGVPYRLNCPPEVTKITLIRA